jgi:spore maturation protein CgeB
MRILYVAMKYDYGRPQQGLSFEHYNFYHSLVHMGHDIVYFDFMTLMQTHGRGWMNDRLLEVARAEKPDVMFTVLFDDELDQAVIRTLTDNVGLPTVNWFCDDHWRFESYSRRWGPCFTWVVTTAQSALPKYAELGYRNVIKSQWACNPFLYRKMDIPLSYDVTFIGQPYHDRRHVIERLRKNGINASAWGRGWESGRVSQEDMIRIFNQSRINLNLTTPYGVSSSDDVPRPSTTDSPLRRIFNRFPLVRMLKRSRDGQASSGDEAVSGNGNAGNVRVEQIKGRNFEVPGCGGFLLTGEADNLPDYFVEGKELVCFRGLDDLIDKVRYYLKHEDERAAIAEAGYQRTMREHTYVHRFIHIFERMGLPPCEVSTSTRLSIPTGHTEEVQ